MKNYLRARILASTFLLVSIPALSQVRSISLRDAVDLASKGNRQIQASLLEDQKAVDYTREVNSYLRPSLNATGGYTYFAERPVIFLRNETASEKVSGVRVGGRNQFSAALNAQYPLFHPVLRSQLGLARLQSKLQFERTHDLSRAIKLQTAMTYLSVLFIQEQLFHLQASRERNEQSLKDSRLLLFQGKALKTDTLGHFITVQNLTDAMFHLKVQQESGMAQLKQLLGISSSETIVLADMLLEEEHLFPLTALDTLSVVAVATRPDIRIQEYNLTVQEQQLKLRRAEYMPQVSVVGQYQLQSQADRFAPWDYQFPRTSFIGLQASVPIFSGNRRQFRQSQAGYSVVQERLRLIELEQKVATELTTLRAELEDAWQHRITQAKNMAAAQVNHSMAYERYKYGLSTRLEFTDAELALTTARMEYARAIYLIRIKQLELQHAMGR
jgi:outer membrane protein TolC